MGTVYRAQDRELNRTVAVKVLRAELVPDLRNLLRLKRELVLASRVNDEHVVRVHDIGEADGRALIAMDWVDGESLAQLLGRVHSLPPSQVLGFAIQICQALRAIHAASIIHRDLKPGNLLIRKDGAMLVSDFGLARSVLPQDFTLTEPGDRGGTPRYMAPEQLAGLPADARSDLYALGMVLLEMLTGTTALEALAPLRLRLLAVQGDKKRRSAELRDLEALDVVVRRCLCPDRMERYATADAVIEDLKRARTELPAEQARPPSKTRIALTSRTARIGLIAALLVSMLLGYVVIRQRAKHSAERAERSYVTAMSLITPRSDESQLRAALRELEHTVAAEPEHVAAIRAELDVLIRLYEASQNTEWLVRARAALGGKTAQRLSSQERTLFQARVDFHAGLPQKVVRNLQTQSGLLGSSTDANLLLGKALARFGQQEQALFYYRNATRLSPESWRAHNYLGNALLALGQLEEARNEFVRVTELHPDSPVGYENLGAVLLDVGDLPAARRNFELALGRSPSPEAYYNLGVAAYYSREYATSIPFFEAAIQLRPKSDTYIAALADVLRHLRRTEPARNAYAQALTLLGQLERSRPLSVEEECRRAICLARLGDSRAATAALDALPTNIKNRNIPYARAVVAFIEGRVDAANRHLKEAVLWGYPSMLVEMDPDFDDVF